MQSVNPVSRETLPQQFTIATTDEIDAAGQEAHAAWEVFKRTSGKQRAQLLRTIADEIEGLGEALVNIGVSESGLPEGRIKGERGRTCNQLRLFADLVEEGSWVEATIDKAIPDRKPLPRSDIRKMLVSIGPVAVFTASNFPLAFSTAGGDTASALAAGCPVIVKAHPSHLGTNALVAQAVSSAVEKCNLPQGVFASIQGAIETGQLLVKHPLVKAVGFTGSLAGGRALFDLANGRNEPIPVYAEMGSTNPIFVLPEKLKSDSAGVADKVAGSVNLGAGQFCTNPGLVIVQKGDEVSQFIDKLTLAFGQLESTTMLNEGIFTAYNARKAASIDAPGVDAKFQAEIDSTSWKGAPAVATVSGKDFLDNPELQAEVFGPFTLVVVCEDENETHALAKGLHGQLTATLMGTPSDLQGSETLIELLTRKAGRVVFNGVPTGVEVCPAMHHGGPYPATTNSLFTSVGTDAIKRFVRPVTYQNAPDVLLPEELRTSNPLGIWRTVNGAMTQE